MMQTRWSMWLGAAAVVGMSATIAAVAVIWLLMTSPQQAAPLSEPASLVALGKWAMGAIRFVAAWL